MKFITVGIAYIALILALSVSGEMITARNMRAQETTKPAPQVIQVPEKAEAKWLVFVEVQTEDGDQVAQSFVSNLVGVLKTVASISPRVVNHELNSDDAFVVRVMSTKACGDDLTVVHVYLLRHTKGVFYDLYLGGFTGSIRKGTEEEAAAQANGFLGQAAVQYRDSIEKPTVN